MMTPAAVVPFSGRESWLMAEELLLILVPLEGVEAGAALVLVVTAEVHVITHQSYSRHVKVRDAYPVSATCRRKC